MALPIAIFLLHSAELGRWVVDDAGITFAYARSVANGHGFVQQPGMAPVEGYSNPLWLALLVVGKLVGVFDSGATLASVPDYVWYPKALGAFCFFGTLLVIQRGLRAALGPARAWIAATIAGTFMASNASYVIWTMSGLENGLFGFLCAALAAWLANASATGSMFDRRTAVGAAVLAFACALTRPDGLIYVGSYPLLALTRLSWTARRQVLRAAVIWLAVTVVCFGAFLGWRYATFHALLPNTAIAKGQGAPQLESLARISELTTYVGLPLTLTFVALVGAIFGGGSDYERKLQRCLLAVLVQLALATLAFVMLNPDWMNEFRFATPVWALASFAIGLGLVGFAADGARSPINRAVFCGALVVAAVVTRPAMTARRALFSRWPTVSLCQVVDEYRLYNLYGDLLGIEKGHLVLPDLGGSSLVSRYVLIDSAGLTDKVVAQKLKQGDAAGLHQYILGEVRPVFLHKHRIYLTGIASDPRFAEYEAFVDQRDYVRRDALKNQPDLDRLTALRAKAPSMLTAVHSVYEQDAKRSCGDRLVPGSLPPRDVLPDPAAAR